MAIITVDPNTSYQTIRGWEATAQAGHTTDGNDGYEYPSSIYPNYKDTLLSELADLGITRLRLEAAFGAIETTTAWAGSQNTTVNDDADPATTNISGFKFNQLAEQLDEVIVPFQAVVEARGEQLTVVLSVVDFRNLGIQLEQTPAEYAEFIYVVYDWIRTNYPSVTIEAVEVVLEPDNQPVDWTAAQVANNIVAAVNRLAAEGYSGVKFIAPSLFAGVNTVSFYNSMKAAVPTIANYLYELSYHGYESGGDITNAVRQGIASAAAADGLPTAQLELGDAIAHVDTLLEDIQHAKVVAWQQYTIAYPYVGTVQNPYTDDGYKYFFVDPQSPWAVPLAKKTKWLKHVFKYVRPGAVVKAASSDTGGWTGYAFENANGAYVAVVRTTLSGSVSVAGLPAGTYGIRYTTGNNPGEQPTLYDQALSNQTITAGQSVTFTMPDQGIATVYDINYLTQPQGQRKGGGRAIASRLLF